MDPEVCRDALGALLTEESAALLQLEGLLHREHEVLKAEDIAALNATALQRQAKIGELAQIEDQRRSLCRFHGRSADRAGLEDLMMWCDPEGSLVARLRKCAERAVRCRELNDRNGALVNARLRNVGERLAALTGAGQGAVTYGPKGSAGPARPGRVLGAA
jgi:flagellar biosynthesis/type III secretory pathway chaperone